MDAESPAYVLDSFALLAYLQNEPGAGQITRLLNLAEAKQAALWICIVNLAEALYIVEREEGVAKTQQTIATIDELPIQIVDVHRPLAFSAAHIKANHSVALADAFAAALAKEKNARLVTGDLEFESIANEIPIEWMQRKKSR